MVPAFSHICHGHPISAIFFRILHFFGRGCVVSCSAIELHIVVSGIFCQNCSYASIVSVTDMICFAMFNFQYLSD